MSPGAPGRLVGPAIVLLVLVTHAAAQSMPDLPLESYPPVAREPIARALAVARAHPSSAARAGALAKLLHAWEQWETAALVYERARALDPQFEWTYLAGVVESRLAHHERAANLFGEAVALSPANVAARLRLGDALLESGQFDAAREAYTAALAAPVAQPHARYGLGRVLAATGEHEAAIREYDEALRLTPEFGAAWYARGLAQRKLKQLDEARESMARARTHGAWWPGVPDPTLASVAAVRDDASARMQRGLALERQGDLAGALREHEAAIAADPALTQAHVNLVALYGRTQEWAKAEARYREAVRLGAAGADAHYNYGIVLMMQGREADAAAALERAVAADPQHGPAWNNLGQYAERTGRLEDALAHYRRAVESRPTEPSFRFNLGRLLIATRAYADAVEQFGRIAAIDTPERPRYLHGLATAWVLAGDVEKGRQYATEARDLAARLDQRELAAAIERDLARLPK